MTYASRRRIVLSALAAASSFVLGHSSAHAQPVQWPTNGNWYEVVVVPQGLCWTDARLAAENAGGRLVTINAADEQEFVFGLIATANPPTGSVVIGLAEQIEGVYVWITGEPLSYTLWYPGEPNNSFPGENRGSLLWTHSDPANGRSGKWNDISECATACGCDYGVPTSYVIEYPCPPEVRTQPMQAFICPTGAATFSTSTAGIAPFEYQWQWRSAGALKWLDVADGVNNDPATGLPSFEAKGATNANVIIGNTVGASSPVLSSRRELHVVVTSPCGETASDAATLGVCVADFNCDTVVNSTDVSDFINAWFSDQVEGTLVTDWDANGVVNSTDVSSFINSWFEDVASGCGT